MSKADRPVLLVGGVPGNSAEQVFNTVAPILGDLAIGLTDGETGMRRLWVTFVLVRTWATHPDLEILRQVKNPPPDFHPRYRKNYVRGCQWNMTISPGSVLNRESNN